MAQCPLNGGVESGARLTAEPDLTTRITFIICKAIATGLRICAGYVFPARWSWTVGSPVNQARRQGRYTVCNIGAYEHTGAEGYLWQCDTFGKLDAALHYPFGEASYVNANAPNGTPYLKQTIEQVDQLPIWSINQPLTSQCPV